MESIFCFFLPLLLLLLAFVVWLTRGKSVGPAPTSYLPSEELGRLLDSWVTQGRLPSEVAAQVLALIREDRARAQPLSTPSAAVAVPVRPHAVVVATPDPATLEDAPAIPGRSWGEWLWDGLLALRTRQTLLFLGAFLLVISALILVVFRWASFPPILQFGLLAAVCGGLWGGGHWMARRWGMARAGVGLQAVGAALMPVVAFSLSRPGLLDLAPRGAWLLASALSLPIYALASWRLRHVLFVVAGCLAAASAVLAALSFVESQSLPTALILTLAAYLPLAHWLRRRAPELAAGPYWVAHGGLPIALLWATLWLVSDMIGAGAFATTLFAAAAFYLLATCLERRSGWGWVAAALAPIALLASLSAAGAGPIWWALAPSLMALAYLGLGAAIESHVRSYALPAYTGAAVLALLGLASTRSWETARWTLPALLAVGVMATLLAHRGRFGWLHERGRVVVATLGLALAGALLPVWALALLDLALLSDGQRGLALLPLAALFFVAARWRPGRVRPSYDLVLQILGALIAFGASYPILFLLDDGARVIAIAALTAVWMLQTILRRRSLWAAPMLGSALLTAVLALDWLNPGATPEYWYALGLSFAGLYALGGTLLRRSSWRCLTWPGIGWGTLIGAVTLLAAGVEIGSGVLARHIVVVVALAGLLALAAALWRRAWPGYLVAGLLALAVLLAADRGFFLPWRPAPGDYGYILCGLVLGLALLGQGLRRVAARYAYPYEIVAFALLTVAPLPAAADSRHACLTWIAMALLYALAAWRYGLPWAVAPALVAADLALLQGAAWLAPGGRPAGSALLLLAATWAQGLGGLWARRREHATPAYLVALLTGLAALVLASGATDILAAVALGLATLLVLLASIERREELAWGALALLALGLGALHNTLGVTLHWSAAWGVAEALALCLIGWAIETPTDDRRTTSDEQRREALVGRLSSVVASIWRRPLWLGPLLAGASLAGLLLIVAPPSGDFPPLTFALATLALLLATLSVRRRAIEYAYFAGAALVAAGLCQLYDWGFRQPQWYVVPAGLYLLVLAEGLRRFQGRRNLAQMVETGAAVLLLGTTLGQSLRAVGLESQGYAVWLCAESLVLLGYGALRQLRSPFFGGATFFVIGVLWLSVDPLLSANKWVLLGLLGLLLVGAYVLLERRQEQLARAGRAWVERLRGWS
ncbi:MAG TPA: hypothetical protein VGJ87_09200 [Roseiflexaceae bacterium]